MLGYHQDSQEESCHGGWPLVVLVAEQLGDGPIQNHTRGPGGPPISMMYRLYVMGSERVGPSWGCCARRRVGRALRQELGGEPSGAHPEAQ